MCHVNKESPHNNNSTIFVAINAGAMRLTGVLQERTRQWIEIQSTPQPQTNDGSASPNRTCVNFGEHLAAGRKQSQKYSQGMPVAF